MGSRRQHESFPYTMHDHHSFCLGWWDSQSEIPNVSSQYQKTRSDSVPSHPIDQHCYCWDISYFSVSTIDHRNHRNYGCIFQRIHVRINCIYYTYLYLCLDWSKFIKHIQCFSLYYRVNFWFLIVGAVFITAEVLGAGRAVQCPRGG